MTRKEIEKRCLDEMQQNIPDSDALWQRIESQLPLQEQTVSEPARITAHFKPMRRFLTMAACLLVAATGAALFSQRGHLNTAHKSESIDAPAVQEDATYAEEKSDSPEQNAPEPETPGSPRTYASLNLPESTETAVYAVSGTQGEYFSESAVLADTDCFVKVRVGSMMQENDSLCYTLYVEETIGGNVPETLTIRSETAYVMQQNHLYLLPLRETENGWELAYACAPQMELTLDGDLIFHNGWQTLMQDAPEPLIYAAYGEDDYFYDRMYLTTDTVLQKFLDEWRKLI